MTDILIRTLPPVVTVVGVSTPIESGMEEYLRDRQVEWSTNRTDNPAALAEFGGRICYGARSFKNPRQTTQDQYLASSIIEHKHESVIEHVHLNFAVEGLPRTTLTELSRHRHVMMSVRSTRYADDYMEFAVPPLFRSDDKLVAQFKTECEDAVAVYERALQRIEELSLTDGYDATLGKKRKREAGRSLLPGSLTCDLLLTMNARTLRHIVQLRTNEHADLSFREFANNLFTAARSVIPELLQDMKGRYVGGDMEIWFG